MRVMRLPVVNLAGPLERPPGFESGPRSISAVRVLRISVTDRCNFRCVYCMPGEGVRWLPKEQLLSFEELVEVARAALELHGITRFKLTGGEPTMRHGLVELVAMLRRLNGIEDLSLTTNGALLEDMARPLRQAGLDRITVSLDSLRPDRFARITRTGDLAKVLRGLDRCEEAGFESLKVNCVTMRGSNDDEVVDFARLTMDRPLTVRFIEYMPLGDAALLKEGNPFESVTAADGSTHFTARGQKVDAAEIGPAGGCGAQDRGEVFLPEIEVRGAIEAALGKLEPVDRLLEAGVGPAVVYRLAHESARGRIGFISAMSEPFCSTCNRLRLTASGVLRSCLFEGGEMDVRSVLRAGGTIDERREALGRAMVDCVRLRPEVHGVRGNEQMSRIGG